jgi:hypothetical protein
VELSHAGDTNTVVVLRAAGEKKFDTENCSKECYFSIVLWILFQAPARTAGAFHQTPIVGRGSPLGPLLGASARRKALKKKNGNCGVRTAGRRKKIQSKNEVMYLPPPMVENVARTCDPHAGKMPSPGSCQLSTAGTQLYVPMASAWSQV